MSNPRSRKCCVVPKCTSTTTKMPDKLFFLVPMDLKIRKKWINAMKRLDPLSDKSMVYCCEDHFDIKEDLESYVKYKILKQQGIKNQLRLKKGVVPHLFACQNRNLPLVERTSTLKRNRIQLVNEALSEDAEKKRIVIEHKEPSQGKKSKNAKSKPTTSVSPALEDPPGEETDDDREEMEEEPPCLSEEPSVRNQDDPLETQDVKEEPEIFLCDFCQIFLDGNRFECIQCSCQLCPECERRDEHSFHYLLRVPAGRCIREVDDVVSRIRQLADFPTLSSDATCDVNIAKQENNEQEPELHWEYPHASDTEDSECSLPSQTQTSSRPYEHDVPEMDSDIKLTKLVPRITLSKILPIKMKNYIRKTSEAKTLTETTSPEPGTSQLGIATSQLGAATSQLGAATSQLRTVTSQLDTRTSSLTPGKSSLNSRAVFKSKYVRILRKSIPAKRKTFQDLEGSKVGRKEKSVQRKPEIDNSKNYMPTVK